MIASLITNKTAQLSPDRIWI